MTIYDGDTITKEGRIFRFNVEYDGDIEAPWEEHDGHGVVSDWTTRDKKPGERLLNSDRIRKRYYNIAETIKLATKDNWGLGDDEIAKLAERLGHKPTKKEITAEAVERDFEYLRRWCANEWQWCGVIVTDVTDDPDAPNDYSHALWGIENDQHDYHEEVANEFIDEILGDLAAAAAAEEKEHVEAAYWAERDVITTTLPTQYERHQP